MGAQAGRRDAALESGREMSPNRRRIAPRDDRPPHRGFSAMKIAVSPGQSWNRPSSECCSRSDRNSAGRGRRPRAVRRTAFSPWHPRTGRGGASRIPGRRGARDPGSGRRALGRRGEEWAAALGSAPARVPRCCARSGRWRHRVRGGRRPTRRPARGRSNGTTGQRLRRAAAADRAWGCPPRPPGPTACSGAAFLGPSRRLAEHVGVGIEPDDLLEQGRRARSRRCPARSRRPAGDPSRPGRARPPTSPRAPPSTPAFPARNSEPTRSRSSGHTARPHHAFARTPTPSDLIRD